ncbi:ABC transporter substrate-binding protein [Sphingomonas oleivorans]|nr:ABC transporter substrate-binding protein [Sphingomonas oleivorans]
MKSVFARWVSIATLTAAGMTLSACSGGASENEAAGDVVTTAQQQAGPLYPDYYPADYAKLVEDSKKEPELLVYSNIAEYNWREILNGFKRKYPWVKVSALDIGPGEAFERYYSETSANKKTADLIVSGAPDAWQRFVTNHEQAEYVSPESSKLPDWSRPFPGLYTLATDPMIIIYNKMLFKPSEYPESAKQLAAMAKADPARFRNRLTTYDASSHSFAYAIHWSVVDHGKPSGWSLMEQLGPVTRPESGGSTMLDKVMGGEYLAAFYTSGITVFPRMKDPGRDRILGWSLPKDGTPMMLRGMAVTKAARSPNSARLMLDYMLSHEGQVAAGQGGMTPYRPDVAANEVPFLTYGAIAERIGGEQNMVRIGYEPAMVTEYKPFIARWNALFKTKR